MWELLTNMVAFLYKLIVQIFRASVIMYIFLMTNVNKTHNNTILIKCIFPFPASGFLWVLHRGWTQYSPCPVSGSSVLLNIITHFPHVGSELYGDVFISHWAQSCTHWGHHIKVVNGSSGCRIRAR